MHFTTAQLVLLNAFLSTALPRPGLIPKLPDAPKVPDTPNLPNAPGGTPEIPNWNNPNPAAPEPGRWPADTQGPSAPADPGRFPEEPAQRPDTLEQPNTTPEQLDAPKEPDAPEQSGASACIVNGKKREACTPNDSRWNNLPSREGQTENQYSLAGRTAISRLDDVRANPPTPKDVQTEEVMNARYMIEETPGSNAGAPRILQKLKGYDINDNSWTDFSVRNTDAEIDAFVTSKKTQIDQSLPQEKIAEENKLLDEFAQDMKTAEGGQMLKTSINIRQRSMVIDHSYNQKFDLHRKYPRNDGDTIDEEAFRRGGTDEGKPDDQKEAVGYTDQVMYGLQKAYDTENLDPKTMPLQNIVRRNIETVETNTVIKAAMAKSGQRLGDSDDSVSFDKGSEEFEAIMGTIHGERMLQMLTDYTDTLGPLRINKVTIMRNQRAIEDDISTQSPSDKPPSNHDSDVEDSEMADIDDSSVESDNDSSGTFEPDSDEPSNSPNNQPESIPDSNASSEPSNSEHDMLFELEPIPEA